MKTIIIGAMLLLASARADATSLNFNIVFDSGPGGQILGSGMYTITDGQITAFHAVITACFNALVECNFNGSGGADPFDGIPSQNSFIDVFSPPRNGTNFSVLNLFESSPITDPLITFEQHQFTTHTAGSFDPNGFYFAVTTPEPSTLWLLFAGSLALLWRKFS